MKSSLKFVGDFIPDWKKNEIILNYTDFGLENIGDLSNYKQLSKDS